MPPEVVGVFVERGTLGVAMLILMGVVRYLYRSYEDYRTKAEAMLAAVNEKRIEEGMKTVAALARSDGVMEKMNDNVERLTTAVQALADRSRG